MTNSSNCFDNPGHHTDCLGHSEHWFCWHLDDQYEFCQGYWATLMLGWWSAGVDRSPLKSLHVLGSKVLLLLVACAFMAIRQCSKLWSASSSCVFLMLLSLNDCANENFSFLVKQLICTCGCNFECSWQHVSYNEILSGYMCNCEVITHHAKAEFLNL